MMIFKYSRSLYRTILITFLFCCTGITNSIFSQTTTDGELTFTVRTVTDNGDFSPKHILAIWIEDSNGFVKTRKLRADKRKQYLYTFNSHTGGNVVDAVTGATLSSHTTHTVTWDCKDVDGKLVPDGEYTVYVEFTDKHSQGPLCTVPFTKGPEAVSLSPADKTYFKDLALNFEPAAVSDVTAGFSFDVNELTVTFTNSSLGAESYSWDFGDSNSSTEMNPVHTYAENGTYTTVLTATKGPASSSYEEAIPVSSSSVGIEAWKGSGAIYPNPGSGHVMLSLENGQNINEINVFNLQGKLVFHKTLESMPKAEINISELPAGTYLVQVKSGEKFSYQKMIRE